MYFIDTKVEHGWISITAIQPWPQYCLVHTMMTTVNYFLKTARDFQHNEL